MTLLAWTLAAMALVVPNRDHSELGRAIADVVALEPPLFRNDELRLRTASLVVAVAYRESTLTNDIEGDHGHSVCAMQIYDGPKALKSDPVACIRMGLAMLRTSMRVCRAHPIAWYAGGPAGCSSARAQRISRDRLAVAGWLLRKVRTE